MYWVIKFDNGSYNQGNGHEVRLVEATRYETHQEAEAKTAELCGVLKIMNVAVHETHCCVDHGCKYGDHDCPVASGEVEQKYDCEECVSGGRLANENLANEAANKIADLFAPGFFDDRMVNDVAAIVLDAMRKKTW
jgi:hypothetical protein